MPNPKTGTVTFDVAKAVQEVKAGKVEFRTDKTALVHVPVGKISFTPDKLVENATAVITSVIKAKPSVAKGKYIKGCYLSSTMGRGSRSIRLRSRRQRRLVAAAELRQLSRDAARGVHGVRHAKDDRLREGIRTWRSQSEKDGAGRRAQWRAEEYSNMIVATYSKLTVAKDYELRKALRSAGAKYRVVKNTLAERAAKGTKVEEAIEEPQRRDLDCVHPG